MRNPKIRRSDLLKVGDHVTLPVTLTGNWFTGTINYIHPERRFIRVEFEMYGRSFIECYAMRGDIAPGKLTLDDILDRQAAGKPVEFTLEKAA